MPGKKLNRAITPKKKLSRLQKLLWDNLTRCHNQIYGINNEKQIKLYVEKTPKVFPGGFTKERGTTDQIIKLLEELDMPEEVMKVIKMTLLENSINKVEFK